MRVASKLNEPVVTNYTRYYKSVKKEPVLLSKINSFSVLICFGYSLLAE